MFALIIAILLASASIFEGANPQPPLSYTGTQTLQSPDSAILYWRSDNQYITFELHVKNTTKWFMFGIVGFPFSDVIVSWINPDGTGHFTDRMLSIDPVSNKTTARLDSRQDWRLIDASVSSDYTVIKFIRPILIFQCDSSFLEDIDITVGVMNLIFAGGSSPNLEDNSVPIDSATTTYVQVNLLNGTFYITLIYKIYKLIICFKKVILVLSAAFLNLPNSKSTRSRRIYIRIKST